MKFRIFLLLVVAVLLTASLPAKPTPRPWSFQYRSEWNDGCVEFMRNANSGHFTAKEEIFYRNACDCMSDGLQQRYTEEENDRYDNMTPPPSEFIKYAKHLAQMCFSDPV